MANMRELRMRVKSLKSTQQMTKSMKMVAASKLRRTQISYGRLKPFADHCYDVLKGVMSSSASEENPFSAGSSEPKEGMLCPVCGQPGPVRCV